MSAPIVLNDNDFESPGYEFLRSYQNMSNLYQKLVALNYQKEFCSLYRCPPIHRYYFSLPSGNLGEQQFLFTCLCAWLIKEKCQMNLELEPEEYEDTDTTIGVILEALKLLLIPDSTATSSNKAKNPITFPPGRLKQGFGPEVIWTMNVLADRALELLFEFQTSAGNKKMKIIYNNKGPLETGNRQSGTMANSITIGQPFVGGGLTTRPLGSYQIDDSTLLFDDEDNDDEKKFGNLAVAGSTSIEAEAAITTIDGTVDQQQQDWYYQVERASQALGSAKLFLDSRNNDGESGGNNDGFENWTPYLQSTIDSRKSIEDFLAKSKSLMNVISDRIDRQLQVISSREKFIQTHLKVQIDDFLKIWRDYSIELNRHNSLLKQVNEKTDKFESHNDRLREINEQIDKRIKELSDGSKLHEFELMVRKLKEESNEFDIKIGLLLTVYAKLHTRITSQGSESH